MFAKICYGVPLTAENYVNIFNILVLLFHIFHRSIGNTMEISADKVMLCVYTWKYTV